MINRKTLLHAMAKKPHLDFEHALKELEVLVSRMEKGDISLEDSLTHFERGIELTRTCQKALKEAEQKVQILMEKDGALEAQPFDPSTGSGREE